MSALVLSYCVSLRLRGLRLRENTIAERASDGKDGATHNLPNLITPLSSYLPTHKYKVILLR